MDEKVIQLLEALKKALEKDERIISLNSLEEKMNNDDSVIKLVIKKNQDNEHLLEMVKYFGDASKEANEARKALQKSKEELYSHPIVKEYNESYQEIRELYIELNRILFSGLNIDCHK